MAVPSQEEIARVLDWLCSPEERGTGRSFAISIALIRNAWSYPGQVLSLFDHAGGRDINVRETIAHIIHNEPDLARALWSIRTDSICLKSPPETAMPRCLEHSRLPPHIFRTANNLIRAKSQPEHWVTLLNKDPV